MSLLSRLAVQAARAYGVLSAVDKNKVSADYLVVAGGASGGYNPGGGGGAGGLLTSTANLSTLNTYSITVGAGGAANGLTGASQGFGNQGSNSVISGTGLSTITSLGGGYGGAGGSTGSGGDGGSGGGAGGAGTVNAAGLGTSGQGNNGGTAAVLSGYWAGGGGGGAGAVGGNAISTGGVGGNGIASSISGSSVTYAGGGGGSGDTRGVAGGAGGTGGGGLGGGNGTTSVAGTANLGGGGGGGSFSNAISAAGGSGIVIIAYTSATPLFVGGTITTSGGKQIHTFTSSGTLSPLTPVTASYLVVAGGAGGAGGNYHGGGGGAGGLLTSSTTLYSGATYIVTVGAGGAGGVANAKGVAGSNSVLSGTGITTVTTTGGGGAGTSTNGFASTLINGNSGGSGGGAGGISQGGGSATGGAGTSGQGNAGGNVGGNIVPYRGGGGGGAGAVGATGGSGTGNGGAGTASSITGSSVTYAGGGGGSTYSDPTPGTGGAGGGGNGGSDTVNPTAGTSNTGGGGGGAERFSTATGGAGGSGIVIISYAGSQAFNGGLVTSSGGNTIHTFTSTGALTPLTNNLNNSLRFRSSASAYLSRTFSASGTTATFSVWVKRGALGSYQTIFGWSNLSNTSFGMDLNLDTLAFYSYSSAFVLNLVTTQVFRDPSAWYHMVFVIDTTQATAANRAKIYINGSQVTALSTATYPAQNTVLNLATNTSWNIGRIGASTTHFDGYMADFNFIDGQALEPYYFGNNDANGVWKPILYKGTYGTNGFYLTFGNTTSTTTLGYDSSPNGNNWTTNNISLTAGTTYDAMTDVPTNTSATVANYAVMNPLQRTAGGAAPTSANLKWAAGIADWYTCFATIGVSSGKYYWEVTNTNLTSSSTYTTIGISKAVTVNAAGTNTGSDADSYVYYSQNGNKINNGSQVAYGAAYVSNDIVGVALDLDNGKLYFSKNGTFQASGDPAAGTNAAYTGLSGTFQPAISELNSTIDINFGQRPFSYTPPTGFVALNTYNLPTPTILQGNLYMDATLWTGTGTNLNVVNAGQFKPDLVWIKNRNTTNYNNLFDSVRGVQKALYSNATDAEATETQGLLAFNSNGFNMGTNGGTNGSGNGIVGWQWQAGQGSTSSNTSGSITSTVSVNTTAGFSVVTYTGTGSAATIGHGLGVAPKWIVVKGRNTVIEWLVYHTSLGATQYITLNTTGAAASAASAWNNTAPTSSVFSVLSAGSTNFSGTNYVAYCWAEIAGFSKFGSYTGNGSADGPFVYTGFRPEFIMYKRTDATQSWILMDTSRSPYNVADKFLIANNSDSEYTGTILDMLSNGFKVREAGTQTNASGGTYIFMAFAENPFNNSNAR